MLEPPTQHATRQVSRLAFYWHARRREWTNFSFRRHRQFDAYIVTMHQSGTHWLKYLLTLLITREHGLRSPGTIAENSVIGGPREPPRYEVRPRLGHSHTIPSPLLKHALAYPALGFPNYLILTRDLRDSLLAHYRKWQDRYGCSFAEYLRGDIAQRRFEKDLWWDLRFMNSWGAIAAAQPGRIMVVHYEDLRRDPRAQLRAIVDFLAVPLADVDAAIESSLAGAGKEQMAQKESGADGLVVVRDEIRTWDEWYSAADRSWLRETCRRHLRHDFGYGYASWS